MLQRQCNSASFTHKLNNPLSASDIEARAGRPLSGKSANAVRNCIRRDTRLIILHTQTPHLLVVNDAPLVKPIFLVLFWFGFIGAPLMLVYLLRGMWAEWQ